ncbi:hypothetical protein E1200_23445 [Actinomadura sp. GC306]|nr:hypothetical protein E1200_23445 [Actinomadura sp. GC306]
MRPLVVIAGKEYGSGASRDWAAKGTALLGVPEEVAAKADGAGGKEFEAVVRIDIPGEAEYHRHGGSL